jgi:mono/diheme cytochrome c family protein
MKARSITPAVFALVAAMTLPSVSLGADAAAAFKTRCAPCHAADGSGNTPMGKKLAAKALGSAEVQKLSDAELARTISAGKGKMPAFGTKLSAEEIAEVVKVIRGFAAK